MHATHGRAIAIDTGWRERHERDLPPPDDLAGEVRRRFISADFRWGPVLQRATDTLSSPERNLFWIMADCLAPTRGSGGAESLTPDDCAATADEVSRMPISLVLYLGQLGPALLGYGNPGIAKVQGLFSALHRAIRTTKPRL